MYDVVILTDKRYEDPKSIDWYIQQVLTEDQLLLLELEKFGLRVIKKAWNSSSFNWSETSLQFFAQHGTTLTNSKNSKNG